MSKLLVVFSATGQQGGSVVDTVLGDAQLSKEYSIRGTTRDPSKNNAQELANKGVEVVKADIDDAASLKKAFEGAHVVFASTVTVYDGKAYEHEVAHGRALADAAVAVGVPFYIYSTLPNAGKISGGKLKNMGHFDGKAEVEQYIRTLPLKSAFFAPGSFMSNFSATMAPHPAGDGTYALFNFVSPETKLPLIHTARDTGKWIGAILADFPKYEGKVFSAATALYTFNEIVDSMNRSSGKSVAYRQLPEETWRGFLPPTMKDHVAEMLQYIQDYGYYGDNTEEKVKWSAEQARGKLVTLDEYFQANPLILA
ncbi:NAD(P)-binding protein [Dothidotthia symphoricarpi CBS 119687]|uniref:NAD(P)-binding protein n=1 Tax=Dothidotthia symphoricarpi CBS 119687 TaxID=1392245 RepID=A0A6A5ZWZ2_9PLEO|nr:NAD(P)-binding protein [Dothidotthia symphoricarpi CBS 119687]KAF2123413.1 NAD(P)-binding protein [Dothidotthia symphoricarpi CBS 119687]